MEEVEKVFEKEQKEFEKLSLEIQESAMWKKFVKKDLPTIISLGFPIAVVSYAVPLVGVGVAGAFGLGAVTMEEKQYRQMAKYPVIFLWSMIFTFIGIIGLFVSPFHFFHKKKDK